MKDPYLLPFILPNVFEISRTLSKEDFTVVLPKLQPLFALKDPPQNMLSTSVQFTIVGTRLMISAPGAPQPLRGENDPCHFPRK
jgi:hypothetical protein